eukprot:m.171590 g.171590  ORF g.171590 m.171590 type:complete len:193 (+) comp16705_c0_seq49:105-683(+)
MGNSNSAIPPEIEKFEANTPLTRQEIIQAFQQFNDIAKYYRRTPHKDGTIRLLVKDVKKAVPQLSDNPLGTRIVKIFSIDGEHVEFVDYLEMVSAFSRQADRQTKLDIAFLLYDYDNDGCLGKNDLTRACRKMANSKSLDKDLVETVADLTLRESDLDGDHTLSKFEFEQILATVPNFHELFRFEVTDLRLK